LVVVGTSQEFLIVLMSEVRCLDGLVGIESIRDPMFTIVISTSCYLHFVSYMFALASFCVIACSRGG
jgi:hypothetical protein